jgi:stage III sporulation protein AD
MLIVKICIFAIIGAFSITVVKDQNREVSILLTVACSLGITFSIIDQLSGIIVYVTSFIEKSGLSLTHLSAVIKTVCVGYFAQISIDLLEDMGVKSVANKIALCAKIIIIALSFPIITELLSIIEGLL